MNSTFISGTTLIKLGMLPYLIFVKYYADYQNVLLMPKCVFLYFLGNECFACGMGSAVIDLLDLNFKGAINNHVLSPVIAILILFLFFDAAISLLKKQ